MKLSDLQLGDILVQNKGFPWVSLALFSTKHPNPHAVLFHSYLNGKAFVVESTYNGVDINVSKNIDCYEVWRPNCSKAITYKAVEWAMWKAGDSYAYGKLIDLLFGATLGQIEKPGMDDDRYKDTRPMICSELVAMSYYRAGYDVVPEVVDKQALPFQLRNPLTCTYMGQVDVT